MAKRTYSFSQLYDAIEKKYGVEIVDKAEFDKWMTQAFVETVIIRMGVPAMIEKGIVRKPEEE